MKFALKPSTALNSLVLAGLLATLGASAMAQGAPAAPPVDNAAYLSSFPDVRTVTPVTVASASTTTNTSPPTDPIFRSLFQAGERTEPVSPRVRELWGNSSSLTSVAPASSVAPAASVAAANPVASATPVATTTPVTPASSGLPLSARTPEVRAPQRLDLFSDRAGIFSS